MTEPPTSPTWDPDASGTGPAPDPAAAAPGFIPPQQQPGYPQGGNPPPGYPPAGMAPPPPGYATVDDKTWALVAHFGGAAGMFVGGAVLGWVARTQSPR